MSRVKVLSAAIVAAAGLAAVSATCAQAAIEGPLYKIEGVALASFPAKKAEVKANAVGSQVFRTTGAIITCKKLKLKLKEGATLGAVIIGAPTGNFEKNEEVIEYTGCSVTGNGEKCAVEGEKINTELLLGKLAWGEKQPVEGTPVYNIFTPKVGTVIAKVKFTPEAGGTCLVAETTLQGSVGSEPAGEGKSVKLKDEPKEAVSNELVFPKEAIKKYFLEESGVIGAEMKPSLTSFAGKATTIEGKLEIELVAEQKWKVSAE